MNVRVENSSTMPVPQDSRQSEDGTTELLHCGLASLTRWLYPRLRGPMRYFPNPAKE